MISEHTPSAAPAAASQYNLADLIAGMPIKAPPRRSWPDGSLADKANEAALEQS